MISLLPIPGAGIFYLIKQAGAGYLLAQTVPPHFIHYFSSNPAGLRYPVFAAGRNVLLFVLDLNPPAALLAESPLSLRDIPPSGGLSTETMPIEGNHGRGRGLLLLGLGCGVPGRVSQTASFFLGLGRKCKAGSDQQREQGLV